MKTESVEGTFVDGNGNVIPRLAHDDRCGACDEKLFYHAKHDSYFCASCNEWREAACCTDPSCEYCGDRPARPLLQAIF